MPIKIINFNKYYYPVASLMLNGIVVCDGENKLTVEQSRMIESHPDYAQWLEMEFIEEVNYEPDVPQSQNPSAEKPAQESSEYITSQPEQQVGELFDIANTKASTAIELIEQITDPEVLAVLLDLEEEGKKRSTVVEAIKLQLGVD
jgi:hypothetical protein